MLWQAGVPFVSRLTDAIFWQCLHACTAITKPGLLAPARTSGATIICLISYINLTAATLSHAVYVSLQILGKHGETLGNVQYAAATYRPIYSMQHPTQQQQAKRSKAQPGYESASSGGSILAVHALQHAESGGQQQLLKQPAKQLLNAGTASLASQDSTALSAFGGSGIPAEWHAAHGLQPGVNPSHGAESDEGPASLHSEHAHEDADSLIPSGSGNKIQLSSHRQADTLSMLKRASTCLHMLYHLDTTTQ